ncbi:MAG: hypothetical protein ACI9EW_003923 [Cellvibrionaceae bacterium]|jgi:hypothetical protein
MKIKRFITWQLLPFLLLLPLIYIGVNTNRASQPVKNSNVSTSDKRAPSNPGFMGESDQSGSFGSVVTPTLSQPVSELAQIAADILPVLVREVNPRINHSLPGTKEGNRNQEPLFFSTQQSQSPQSAQFSVPIAATDVFTTPILNFEGSPFSNVNPPDTIGAIGKDYYIQMVNDNGGSLFRIYDRTGALVHGPISLKSLGTGACASGIGDPVVLYDQLAGQWFMSEFSNVNSVCHYISQTGDPTGSWYAYEFVAPSFPDYPKYGLWPSAYIGTANEGVGPAVYAFDRLKMLKGEPAGYIRFVAPKLTGFGFQALTPVDMDGTFEPSAGDAPLYLRHRDDEIHAGTTNGAADFIEIWTLTPDFETPSNSAFTKIADITIAEFDSTMCTLNSVMCVPQKGSATKLDPVREVLMNRVQYKNHATHQSIVGNMVTEIDGNSHHGIFWFELRKTDGAWVLYQDGILSPDSEHRWMGSISMDASQNIALLYNVSGANTFPSLRYSGRTADMPLGTLIAQEGSIAEGTAANASSRYGDYSSLTLDPLDGCTFWATGEYNPASTWSTRIATFKFPGCQAPISFLFQKSNPIPESLVGTVAQVPVLISASDAFTQTVAFSVANLTSGSVTSIAPISLVPVMTPTQIIVSIADATVGPNSFVLTGTSPVQSLSISVDFIVVPKLVAPVTIIRPADGETLVPVQPTLEWSAAVGATSYTVELSTDPLFATNAQVYTDIQSITFTLPAALSADQDTYWHVKPINVGGAGPWAAASFRTEPAPGLCQNNQAPVTLLQTGFESGLDGWEITGINSSWVTTTTLASEGSSSIKANAHSFTSTQQLTAPSITLSPLADSRWLSFDIWRDLESDGTVCYDGLVLEIEKNGEWKMISPDNVVTDPFDYTLTTNSQNPLGGNGAWCGIKDWTQSLINLSGYTGEIRFRYQLASDESVVGGEGVYIDNVSVYECNPQDYTNYLPIISQTGSTP